MALVNIKLVYDYYTKKRVTPIFMTEEELLDMSYTEFRNRIVNEISHLKKINTTLKFTVIEDSLEVDLSVDYFNVQIRGMLEKGKTIVLKAFAFESPGLLASQPLKSDEKAVENAAPVLPSARRSLCLSNQQQVDSKHQRNVEQSEEDVRVLLPLERYAKKQQENARIIERNLNKKREEISQCRERLKRAADQNQGNLSVCGNCHLKIGHTRKKCEYSPCRSAYSCGIIAKHGSEKVSLSALEKDVARLGRSLASARNDIENAERAADKVINSAPKRIEDTIIKELPDRYTTFGRRNWALLNRDVAFVQKNLQGRLPSREIVLSILNSFAPSSFPASGPTFIPPSDSQRTTDHRMSSQKKVLSQEYGINFPTDQRRQKPSTSNQTSTTTVSTIGLSSVEREDFKLALQLQREEIDSEDASIQQFSFIPQIDEDGDDKTQDKDLEFEANAAAALLQLNKRKHK